MNSSDLQAHLVLAGAITHPHQDHIWVDYIYNGNTITYFTNDCITAPNTWTLVDNDGYEIDLRDINPHGLWLLFNDK